MTKEAITIPSIDNQIFYEEVIFDFRDGLQICLYIIGVAVIIALLNMLVSLSIGIKKRDLFTIFIINLMTKTIFLLHISIAIFTHSYLLGILGGILAIILESIFYKVGLQFKKINSVLISLICNILVVLILAMAFGCLWAVGSMYYDSTLINAIIYAVLYSLMSVFISYLIGMRNNECKLVFITNLITKFTIVFFFFFILTKFDLNPDIELYSIYFAIFFVMAIVEGFIYSGQMKNEKHARIKTSLLCNGIILLIAISIFPLTFSIGNIIKIFNTVGGIYG